MVSKTLIRERIGDERFYARVKEAERAVFFDTKVVNLGRAELLYLVWMLSEERRQARETVAAIEKLQRTPWVMFGNRV